MLQSAKEQDQMAAFIALTMCHKMELVWQQRFADLPVLK